MAADNPQKNARARVADMVLGTLTTARDEKQKARTNLANEIDIAQSELSSKQAAVTAKQSALADLDADLAELQSQIDSLAKGKGS